jgi:hypothetical protein
MKALALFSVMFSIFIAFISGAFFVLFVYVMLSGNTEIWFFLIFSLLMLAFAILMLFSFLNIILRVDAKDNKLILYTALGKLQADPSQIHGAQGRMRLWICVNREDRRAKLLYLLGPFYRRVDLGSIKLRINIEK